MLKNLCSAGQDGLRRIKLGMWADVLGMLWGTEACAGLKGAGTMHLSITSDA